MKKIIALVMAVTMVAAMMVGCGSSSKSDDSAKGNGEVTIKFGIHVIQKHRRQLHTKLFRNLTKSIQESTKLNLKQQTRKHI